MCKIFIWWFIFYLHLYIDVPYILEEYFKHNYIYINICRINIYSSKYIYLFLKNSLCNYREKSLINLYLVWDHPKPTAVMTRLISSLHNFSFSIVSFWILIHLNIHLFEEESESCTCPIICSNQRCFIVQLRTLQRCTCTHAHTMRTWELVLYVK